MESRARRVTQVMRRRWGIGRRRRVSRPSSPFVLEIPLSILQTQSSHAAAAGDLDSIIRLSSAPADPAGFTALPVVGAEETAASAVRKRFSCSFGHLRTRPVLPPRTVPLTFAKGLGIRPMRSSGAQRRDVQRCDAAATPSSPSPPPRPAATFRPQRSSKPTWRPRAASTEEASTSGRTDVEALTPPAADRTLPAQILDPQTVIDRLFDCMHPFAEQHYHAFFSSELGGITTEPALMMLHLDDHLVHRGHAVFDTAHISGGKLYLFEQHFQRFLASADKARLELPCSEAQLRRIILETAAASTKMDGFLRFWLGAGRGGFGISPSECFRSSFYCLATTLPEGSPVRSPNSDYLRGRRVKTSPVPIKDPFFATLKSNNYLANALTVMDAETDGFDYGIFVDEEGFYAEGATMNVAILTQEGELVIPPFEQSLGGITAIRLLQLVEQQMESLTADSRGALRSIARRKFNKQDVFEAREAMLIGSTTYVTSIVRWDEMDKGEGTYGDQ